MLEIIESSRLIPVVAVDYGGHAEPLASSLISGGLPIAEITLRTGAAMDVISRLAGRTDFHVGAGTVHTVDQAKQVVDAGAGFIVAPGFNPNTVRWCVDHSVPIFPGVSSPTDLEMAIEFELKVVKFFPAELIGGVKMLKALSGPFGDIRFIPTGGINPQNLAEYLRLSNVVACGGSWMVKPDLIREEKFNEVRRLSSDAVSIAREV